MIGERRGEPSRAERDAGRDDDERRRTFEKTSSLMKALCPKPVMSTV